METPEVEAAERAIAAALRSAAEAGDPADKVEIVSRLIGLLWTATRDAAAVRRDGVRDRKSTRLNSSHVKISYAVFCLKKKTDTIRGELTPHDPTNSLH